MHIARVLAHDPHVREKPWRRGAAALDSDDMTNPPVYRAHSIPDLLNVVPTLFGFVPEESFIGICVSGSRRKFGFRLRVDLPKRHQTSEVAHIVANHLERGEGEAVILVALSADTERAEAMVRAVVAALSMKKLECAVWANDTSWWSCDDEVGGSWQRDPCHESIVTAVRHGQVIRPNRAAIAEEFESKPPTVATVVMERVEHELEVLREQHEDRFMTTGVVCIEHVISNLLGEQKLSDEDFARVAIYLRTLLIRDHFWFGIDRDNAREMLDVWAHIATRLEGRWRSAPLSLASFSAWQIGDGVRTLLAAEAAMRADDGYSLAQIMLRVVEQGVPPESWKQMRIGLSPSA